MSKVKKITVKYLKKRDLSRLGIDDGEGWYIDDPNNDDYRWAGPFDTKAEAMENRRGLERFWKDNVVA